MAENHDRVLELYKALRAASRDAFLFQTTLAELTEEELAVLEKVCALYEEKIEQSYLNLVGYRRREDLEPSLGKRLKRLFWRKHR